MKTIHNQVIEKLKGPACAFGYISMAETVRPRAIFDWADFSNNLM